MKLLITLFVSLSMHVAAQTINTNQQVKFLALGDSYTIGQSAPADARWPNQLSAKLQTNVDILSTQIIAMTGWRTDNLKSAIGNAGLPNDHTLVSVLIGVNNFYQGGSITTYAAEFEQLLETAIQLAKGRAQNVFVVSIPDYGYTPFGQSNQMAISAGIDLFNARNSEITQRLGVKYYSITDISRRGLAEPDLVATDGLHPSGKMYAEWVERIYSGITFTNEPIDDGGVVVPDPVTSLNENASQIQVYPNPFDDWIRVTANDNTRTLFFQLFDGFGNVVFEHDGKTRSLTVDLRETRLPPGLYAYHIYRNGAVITNGKLIKR